MFFRVVVILAILSCAAYVLWLLNLIAIRNEIDLLVLIAIIIVGSVFTTVASELIDIKEGANVT